MTLKSDIISDIPDVFFDTDEFSGDVSYTPTGGAASTIEIIKEAQDPTIMEDAPPGDALTIQVQTSEVSNPQRGDSFLIDSETWYLLANLGEDSGIARLSLSRSDKRRI